jgi:protein SCO1/2
MRQKIFIWLFMVLVLSVPAGLWFIVKWHEHRSDLPVLGVPGHTIGNFEVVDQNGRNINAEALDKKITVANFFFTHCPVVCPKMMTQLKRVQASVERDIQIMSFSVDPERDSVPVLKKYDGKHNISKNWLLLTGNKREIYRLARNEMLVIATDGDGGPDDFIHSDNLLLVDHKRQLRGFYKGTDERQVNQLIEDINKLSKERQ